MKPNPMKGSPVKGKRGRPRKPRKPVGRPPKPKLPPVWDGKMRLSDFPAELIGLIAFHLLPTLPSKESGFPSPHERPYALGRGISGNEWTVPYGAIPRAVRDVQNLRATCSSIANGVDLVVGTIGGIGKDSTCLEGRKRTLYVALPGERVRSPSPDEVKASKSQKVWKAIFDCRKDLEHLVIHECAHADKITDHFYPTETPMLDHLPPWQSTLPEGEIVFPNLHTLQLGPNTCPRCTDAVVQLLCNRQFKCRDYVPPNQPFNAPAPAPATLDEAAPPAVKAWHTYSSYTYYGGNSGASTRVEFEPAAKRLSVFQLHVPEKQLGHGSDADVIRLLVRTLHENISLDMLQLWLKHDDHLGGLGPNGTCTFVEKRPVNEIEMDLTKRGEKALGIDPVKEKRKVDRNAELLAKFKQQAKAALGKPCSEPKEPCPANGPAASGSVASGPTVGGPTASEPTASTSTAGGSTTSGSTPTDPVPASTHIPATLAEAAAGPSIVKAESSRSISHGMFSDDEGDEEDDDVTPVPGSVPVPMHHERVIKTSFEKVAGTARMLTSHVYGSILADVARYQPDLVGLQILRRGHLRPTVVETKHANTNGSYASFLVNPLKDMPNLRYLDLGIAICAETELADFPLALSVHDTKTAKRKRSGESEIMTRVKRHHYVQDAVKARKVGEDYRKTMLEGFTGLRKRDHLGDGEVECLGWPKTVRSGHVYTVDLEDRAKKNGLLIPWRIEGDEVVFDKAEKIKL